MEKDYFRVAAQFAQIMATKDEFLDVLLKGHLLIEEMLEKILKQYVFHREHLDQADLSFYKKMCLCRSFCLRKNNAGEWSLLAAINSLRNEVAHNLTPEDRQKKIQIVKDLYFRESAGFDKMDEIRKKRDHEIILLACVHCAGFLMSFEADSKAYRRMVHAMDRDINKNLPEFEL